MRLSLVVAAPGRAPTRGRPTVTVTTTAAGQAGCQALCAGLDGLRLPDLPVPTELAAPGESRPPHDSGTVVRRGDCLWKIAAELVGPRSRVADVASAAWTPSIRQPRSGSDLTPNLIFPGTQLTLPEVIR